MAGILNILLSIKASTITDPFFSFVTMLLNTISTNGANNNTFQDSSTYTVPVARSGTSTQGSFSPFSSPPGYWSGYFGGTGYYATFPQQSLPTATDTFTIEAWIYQLAYPVAQGTPNQPSLVGDQNPTGSGANWQFGVLANGKLSFWWNDGTTKSCVGDTVTSLNTWTHVAVSVSSNAISLYVGGVLQVLTGTTTLSNRNIDQLRTTIGQYANTNSYINSYVSNLRIVTGAALYSGSLIPVPTSPLGISGTGTTTLLTLQNANAFKDSSSNNRTIIPTLASSQSFYPFATTAAYSTSLVGGSGYFDGTSGNYISFTKPALSSIFTYEFWIYPISLASGQYFVISQNNTASGFPLIGTTGTAINVAQQGLNLLTGSANATVGAWNHIALVREGPGTNQLKLYLNGNNIGSRTYATAIDAQASSIGGGPSANGVNAYFSSARLVNGTAVYTSNFTPPTAPLGLTTGGQNPPTGTQTQFLFNFTNASIYDAAAKNDLVTVGSAQSSTTQAKFGPTSIGLPVAGSQLTANDTVNLQLGTGDFTIDGWFYLSTAGVAYGILSKGSGTSTGWSVNVTSGNKLQFSYSATSLLGTTTLSSGTWYYFAVVRFGSGTGNLKLYLNASVEATSAGAVTDNFNQNNTMYVGADRSGANALNGYLEEIRITKGYARTITLPSAPFPVQ
jgi:Concanavalin A-like lectin/glucanases superfamily